MTDGASVAAHPGGGRGRSHLICLGLYLLLAVALTWPLAAHPATRVPAGDDDLWQNYWNFWWWKEALLERRQSPYRTDLLFHPEGAPLGLHTHSEANQILALPINAMFGPAAALNLSLLAGFALGGFGAYLLAREYTPRAGSAFVAGAIFAFFPQHVEQSLEHLNLASIEGIPLFLWSLVRLVRRGGRRYVPTALLFSLNCMLGWHNGMLAFPLGVALAAFEMRESRRPVKGVLLDLVKAALVAAVLLAPIAHPMLRDILERAGYFRKTLGPRPIDPLFLIIPHPGHPLWGGLTAGLYEKMRTYASVGFIAYVGLVPLFLAAAALRGQVLRGPRDAKASGAGSAARRQILFWAGAGLFFLSLSFGTTLTFAGQEHAGIPMPYAVIRYLPFFSRVRVPHRFLVPAVLCLAIIAALGVERIARRLPARRGVVAAAFAVLVLLEFLWLPYPTRSLPELPWVRALEELPKGLAVLDIPGGHRSRAADDMYAQTLHGRALVGGYVSVPLWHVSREIDRYPVLRRIFQSKATDTGYSGPTLERTIRAVDAGIVVVHMDRTVEALRESRLEASLTHPDDPYRRAALEPDEGMPRELMDRMRAELRESFGPPIQAEPGVAEVYLVSGPQFR